MLLHLYLSLESLLQSEFISYTDVDANRQTPTNLNDLQTTPLSHSIPSGQSSAASTSAPACVPKHSFNLRPSRSRKHAEQQGDGVQSRSSVPTRGPNTSHKLKPDAEKGEKAWPLFLNNRGRPIGDYAEKWGKYVGTESRVYCKYPLHLEWGDEHNRSFDEFFIRCQKDYEFLPMDPNQPLSHHIIYRGMKSQLQEMVRYNRCQVKHECFEVWKNTPEAEREALWLTPAFSWIDRDSWTNLCAYYDAEDKKEEARRNAQNRASNLHGRATDTSGSRNMCWAMEQLERVIEKATSSGVGSTPEDDALSFTQMLDSLHGGHHGCYERGLGIGVTRSYLRASSIPEIGTSNQELRREVADLRARVAEMDSLREELRSQMHWINNNMVNSSGACPAPTPNDPPSFTRPGLIPQPAADIRHSARPASATNTSTSSTQGLSQENLVRIFAYLRRSGLSQEDILRGISSVP
ncbi:uncharacterized protein LOC109831071 isoform X2 [Asparagus officinalis]|uniref:uncharacterized protein LOC109831071 isoform X2 n=1 Tax=Asparagus officinalis TaxID=4686 RepID=UPI00098E5D07|nr:uncharacterized protein LOC109831071 isoform X2 [Asparagus officinalis]